MMQSSANAKMIGIIGGGVAGMSCSLWLKHLGFAPVIAEQGSKLGGQMLRLNRVNRWVLGFPGKTSQELADIYAAHINLEGIEVLCQAHLLSVSAVSTGFELLIDQSGGFRAISVMALVIATGLRVLSHEIFGAIPGYQSLSDAGLISCFPLGHLDKLLELNGKTVAVIGGGDNAHYTAKDIALAGARVYLLIRSNHKARVAIRNEIENYIKQEIVTERTGARVTAFRQDNGKIEINLQDVNGIDDRIQVDRVFIRTGFAANSEFLDTCPALSGMAKESGYISTDPAKRTSIPWVYAIGDVSNPKHQSVASAIADGAIAAQDLSGRI